VKLFFFYLFLNLARAQICRLLKQSRNSKLVIINAKFFVNFQCKIQQKKVKLAHVCDCACVALGYFRAIGAFYFEIENRRDIFNTTLLTSIHNDGNIHNDGSLVILSFTMVS